MYIINRNNQRLKLPATILLFLVCHLPALAQSYYFKGEVKDESDNVLQNVSILHKSTGYVYYTGVTGSFGFAGTNKSDTLIFSKDGFIEKMVVAMGGEFTKIKLKKNLVAANSLRRNKLSSFTKDLSKESQRLWFIGDETYTSIIENRFVKADKYPTTALALNIDRASYSNIRRFLNMNTMVPPDAVRIEEMINYFNVSYQQPSEDDDFKISTTLTNSPWNKNNQLYFINVSSKKINLDSLPPSNLVFLVDISGSMDMPNRLPLLKSAFRLLVNNLRCIDSVSLVVYGGTVGIKLETTGGDEKAKILKAIDELEPGGSTPGESGIRLAYSVARNHYIKDGNNRVILATDGDFNVGLKTETELDDLISTHRQSGIYLTCLGVGMGNYKDSKIQVLARKGNGNFSYLDNFQEAEKILLQEFTETLYAVADNVSMNVDFNKEYVKEYRLIGYDNKVGAISDSLSDIEGGEIGSGHSMMAVFEIVPTAFFEYESEKSLPFRRFADVKIVYSLPKDSVQKEFSYRSYYELIPFNLAERYYRFSSALIMFGSLLRNTVNYKSNSWNDILQLANSNYDATDIPQKEFITLVEKAKEIYSKKKKKKNRSKHN